MTSTRKTAIIAGVLWIIASIAGVLGYGVFLNPILSAPDYLFQVSANEIQIITGAFLILVMAVAVAWIPVMLFPILKKHNETLAVGYVVSRALEAVCDIVAVISWLLLLTLSQGYVKAGAPAALSFQTLGTILLQVDGWINPIMTIVFIIGTLGCYYLLYQSKLIPRWLSGWGLIAAIPYLAAGLLLMFALISASSTTQWVLMLPLGLQEMVLAIWLIVKGFNTLALASGSAETDINEIK
jgi:hypothetical protein